MVIAGGSGLVGGHTIAYALAHGWKVRVLSRREGGDLSIGGDGVAVFHWDPEAAAQGESGAVEEVAAALSGADFLINLAGASVGSGRFSSSFKERLRKSRLDATRALRLGLGEAKRPPLVMVQASAVGYYGNTGNLEVDESAPAGNLFLSDLCVEWESEARLIQEELKLRLAIGRIGLVLSKDAPAWKKYVAPIRLGLGGAIGGGRQWYSWIDGDDLAASFFHLYRRDKLEGVFNLTATHPVRQKDFTRVAAEILRRPSIFPVPGVAMRILLGEAADELILASCKALPARLLNSGFEFQRDTIELQLVYLLSEEHHSSAKVYTD